jgi:enoyl-CoA hydratase/carnithine racemase
MVEIPGVAFVALADLRGSLIDALESVRAEESVRCVVIDGTGAAGSPAMNDAERWLLERYTLPVVFAAAGHVSGAGMDAAVLSDIRVCDAATGFDMPGRATRRLAELFRNEIPAGTLDAESAFAAGFVSEVTESGGALAAATRIAAVIASRGPIATRLAKEAIWRGLRQEFEQALRFETDLTLLLQTTKDRAEGVRAFVEKRPPVFTGE